MYLQDPEISCYSSSNRKREHSNGIYQSFFRHIRPRRYPQASLRFDHTFHLGFWTTFLFTVEIVTGVLLMFYYVPTPEAAYQSIQRLAADIPFGQLFRALHRLAGDLLIIVAILHLLRVAVTGSYSESRRFTWVTGMILLLLILVLAFSGYLLPWDQLSYWAVTVGTSLFQAIPLIGEPLQQALRGGTEIGEDGLLRFYVLHVLILPGIMIFFLAIHYYRLVRLHGISLPLDATSSREPSSMQWIAFWPEVVARETALILTGMAVLLLITGFLYDAPLAAPANPLHTPSHTQAPWFFLWIQGLLTLGATSFTGIILPMVFILAVTAYPYLDREGRRPIKQRPKMLAALLVIGLSLSLFSYLGSREDDGYRQSPEGILNTFAPRDGGGPLHVLPYDALNDGVYMLIKPLPRPAGASELGLLIAAINVELQRIIAAKHFTEATGFLIIEPWQAGMKRITLRFTGLLPASPDRQTFERQVFRHDAAFQKDSGKTDR